MHNISQCAHRSEFLGTMNTGQAARQHFVALSRDEKVHAIYTMADTGYSDYLIATATRLSVEMIRQILAARHAVR